MKVLSILLASSAALFAESPQKQKLEFKYEPGKTYSYEQVMSMDMAMKNPATDENMNIQTQLGLGFTYNAESDPQGVKVSMGIDQFSVNTGSNGVSMMRFDSSDEEQTSPFAQMFTPFLDMNFSVTFDDEGQVVDFSDGANIPGLEQAGLDAEQFKQTMTQGYSMMPDTPVSVGDTWTSTQSFPMGDLTGEEVKISVDYKLISFEQLDGHNVAKISYSSDPDLNLDREGVSIELDVKEFSGFYWHDTDMNITRKATLSTTMVMKMGGNAEAGENGLSEIPYDMEMVMTLK